jgi:mannose-6-phosphate isomerase
MAQLSEDDSAEISGSSAASVMIAATAEDARGWFLDTALPLWLDRGLDRGRGGFYEALDPLQARNTADFRRLRVVTRQIYVSSAALRLGAQAAREGLEHGLAFLTGPARHADGGFASRFDLDGRAIDGTRDLYDLAFVAFALAHAFDVTGAPGLRDEAVRLAAFLSDRMRHADGGFVEALPPRAPRRQNPHMHLFEAALAWAELDPGGPYPALARELGQLFRTRFFQREAGTLPEYYDAALRPLPREAGQAIEPGHHFEWAWLLHHAARLGVLEPGAEADALYRFAHAHGIDAASGLPLGEIASDGTPISRATRLWCIAEWLKAECVRPGADRAARVERAWAALRPFLDTPIPGLWHEGWDGSAPVPGPAPATTFYHLTLAIEVLLETAGRHPRPFGRPAG